jgi:molecular chaperone GrpE
MQEEEKKDKGDNGLPDDKLAKCEQEKNEYLDGWKRAKADLINYKKDENKRFEDVVKYGQQNLLRELVSVLDSFDLALVSEDVKADAKKEKGMYLIRQQMEDILKRNGLQKIEIKIGDPFDPAFAEAIEEVESKEYGSGCVVEEVERGYKLNERVIRAARVKVAK